MKPTICSGDSAWPRTTHPSTAAVNGLRTPNNAIRADGSARAPRNQTL